MIFDALQPGAKRTNAEGVQRTGASNATYENGAKVVVDGVWWRAAKVSLFLKFKPQTCDMI